MEDSNVGYLEDKLSDFEKEQTFKIWNCFVVLLHISDVIDQTYNY